MKVRDLATGKDSDMILEGVAGGAQWGDCSTLFYCTEDEAKRPHKVWRHRIGHAQSQDVCLLTEDDEVFSVGIGKSLTGRLLVAGAGSTETDEWYTIDLEKGWDAPLTVVQPRQRGMQYDVDHLGGMPPSPPQPCAVFTVFVGVDNRCPVLYHTL